MSSNFRSVIRRSYPVLAAMVALAGTAGRALAVDDTFYNDTYYNSSAQITATNFVNDSGGVFDVTPGIGSGWLSDLYDAWSYTRNFTNNGEMDSITGFRFETHITSTHRESDNFFNTGNINCGTGGTASGAIFIINGIGASQTIQIGGFGGIEVSATNVYNTGTINIGSDGLARIYGHNIDFTRGTLTMESSLNTDANGTTGQSTNDWFPDTSLLPTSATTSPPPLFTNQIGQFGFLTTTVPGTTPYFSIQTDGTGTNVIVRMIFVENILTNTLCNVYFGNTGNGFATVEWAGPYTNAPDGQILTNYLYLTDDYVLGASTNILGFNGAGVPRNYTFSESATPQQLGTPQVSNYPSIFGPAQPFPAGVDVTTNIYSFVDARFIASAVPTNSVANASITNLPGRIEMVASNEMNLSLASMSGMNYLMLRSTNNYDNDGESIILAPYADVYLGRTNNNMVISNLLVSSIPLFSGSVQAWNTRWLYTDTTQGINYDYRALVVQGAVSPVTSPQQQDFMLYSSNNVTISDTLSIYHSFFTSCTNMLLTQNPVANGAYSLDGELNLLTPNITWATATPRLRNLTNNGAIRTVTQGKYGTLAAPYFAFVSTGTISNGAGVLITANDFENSGLFTAGSGSFIINSTYTTMTNGTVIAAGVFSNSSALFTASNTLISAGRSLTLLITNILTDGSTTNNFWSLGTSNSGLGIAPGLILPVLPPTASLLGTTITNPAVSGTLVNDLWAGKDYGAVNAGFSNNAAIGQLVLDAKGPSLHTGYYFTGTLTNGMTNAIYVDCLQLHDYASYTNRSGTNLAGLTFNTNLVIYYAQALIDDGSSVAEKINHFNTNHLRWVSSYTGIFSSTNLIYPDGTTNTVNAALAASALTDSDGDGIPNSVDPSPVFTPNQLNFTVSVTNLPPQSAKIQWVTVANGTNYIYYKTNLLSPAWMPFTGFNNFYYGSGQSGTNGLHTNWFPSPFPYPSTPGNVWIYDPLTNTPHFYQVVVQPWTSYPN